LVAYYTAAEPGGGGTAGLRDALREKLPAHLVPSAFVALESIPRTPNGKIDRAALPPPDRDGTSADGEPLAPRDDLEAALVAIWADTLGVGRLGIRDDFFAAGGDSLLAVRLLARIAQDRRIGADVPLAALLESPTVEALARRMREASAATNGQASRRFAHLVPVQPGHGGPPLFCVHGAGGNVLNMRAIADHMGARWAFWGIQARGVDGVTEPHARIEAMAAAYLDEVRAVQPRGPYFLSGYCGGGLVAFEMARSLQALGERVALLALVDTYRPGSVPQHGRWRRAVHVGRRGGMRGLAARGLAWITRTWDTLAQQLRVAFHRLRRSPIPHTLRDFWLTASFMRSAAAYRPGVFRGRLTVLRAADGLPRLAQAGRHLGWSGHASEGVEVYDVPGGHDTMATEPHVAVLGSTLAERMSAATADGPAPRSK
jgi:thioesterase domain-containing protein